MQSYSVTRNRRCIKIKTPQLLYDEHLNRIKKAFALEEQDRPPIMFNAMTFTPSYMGFKLSEYINDVERANNLSVIAALLLGKGEIDCFPTKGVYPPAREVFVKMKLPGRDLPEDTLWQVDEKEVMTEQDYDTIIEKGFNYFYKEYSTQRMGSMLEHLKTMAPTFAKIARNITDAGIVILTPVSGESLFEFFCTARSMGKFLRDLHRIPDKVQAAMDVAIIDVVDNVRQKIRAEKPLAVFVGGSRAALVSAKLFERFDLSYRKLVVEAIVEEGALVNIHSDSNWDHKFEYMRELPKAKCALALDGTSNIFKAKEVLGDHMCIMGDVPASLLTLGSEEEVYNYCTRLVNEVGSSGFIMSAGCNAPPNAKIENVKAMIAAVTGK